MQENAVPQGCRPRYEVTGFVCCFILGSALESVPVPFCWSPMNVDISLNCWLSLRCRPLSPTAAMFAMWLPRTCALPILVFPLTLPLIVRSQSDCPSQPPRPVLVPIRNVTVADGVIRRGAALSLGTQPQDLAFEVLGYVNWLYQLLGVEMLTQKAQTAIQTIPSYTMALACVTPTSPKFNVPVSMADHSMKANHHHGHKPIAKTPQGPLMNTCMWMPQTPSGVTTFCS